jgi:hypothetical protein
MVRTTYQVLAVAVATITLAACADSTSPSAAASAFLDAAYSSTPAGFSSTDNTYSAGADMGEAWRPDRNAHFGGGMMGGGLGPEFFGGVGLGRGFDRGPFGFGFLLSNCTFSSTTGSVSCPDETHRGLTISRSFAFKDASGIAQSGPSSATNSVSEHLVVAGTVTRHDGKVTSTVNHSSDRTVTGLAAGSTQRTVDGGSKGTESSTGTTEDGTQFTSSRLVADTVKGLIVPLQDGHPTYPTAGTIHRIMRATITLSGKAPVASSRDETVTYNGSNTATVVLIKDGTTKNCTLPLPFGKLSCQ